MKQTYIKRKIESTIFEDDKGDIRLLNYRNM